MKKFTTLFLVTLFAMGLVSIFGTEQAKAVFTPVNISANICGGGPLANVAVSLGGADGCTTGASGSCVAANITTGATYNITVTPPSGYNVITTTTGACTAAPTTLSIPATVASPPAIAIFLTSSTGGTTYGLTTKPLKDIINGITEWLLGIAAGLAILYLVWGGIYYVTASGDETQVEEAKRIIKYALIGLFVIGISYSVVVLIDKLIK